MIKITDERETHTKKTKTEKNKWNRSFNERVRAK